MCKNLLLWTFGRRSVRFTKRTIKTRDNAWTAYVDINQRTRKESNKSQRNSVKNNWFYFCEKLEEPYPYIYFLVCSVNGMYL